jgi:hypothetical protein
MFVCGTCAALKPNDVKITPLPASNEFEVPVTDDVKIHTCEPCYVPTLTMNIGVFAAAGVARPDLEELRDVYLSEHRVPESGNVRPIEEWPTDDEPAEEDQEDEPKPGDPHRRTLDEVNDELDDLDDQEDEEDESDPVPPYSFNYTADFHELGKRALRDWAKGQRLISAGHRGTIPQDVMNAFARSYGDDLDGFCNNLNRHAEKSYKRHLAKHQER